MMSLKKCFVIVIAILIAVLFSANVVLAQCCVPLNPVATADNRLSDMEHFYNWKLLFDGKTLNNWQIAKPNDKSWKVVNRTIYTDGTGSGYLYTKQQYSNFELKFDFKISKGGNSGVFFRVADIKDIVGTGIEMQIFDSYGREKLSKHDCGAIYDILEPSENACKPALEWNSAAIRAQNNFITVIMNDKKIITMDLNKWTEAGKNPDGTPNKFPRAYKDMPRKGYIALQNHGSEVWYKNIRIKELN
ncbi:MAG: DUF1080 domain-containing protein [Armatimonadota bacterium]